MRDKEIFDRKTKRPVLNKEAAGRFIRHGLYEPKPLDKDLLAPKNKKRKFEDI